MIQARNINLGTIYETASLPNNATISNVGGYNYKKIPGLEITMPTKIGATYLIVANASLKPTALAEVYLQNRVNDTNVGSKVVSSVSNNDWCSITNAQIYTATGTSTHFAIYAGASGASSIGLDILRQSSIVIIQIG